MAVLVLFWWLSSEVPPLGVLSVLVVAIAVADALSRRPIARGSRSVRLLRTGMPLLAILVPLSAVTYLLGRADALVLAARALEWPLAAILAYQALPQRLHAAWRLQWR